eukprot:TRINITY_DN6195_c0_g1_i1.p1 TRINITY_DN6195_c0_g1~~TRINITY_DN6195_c0_g1_i1.p1  ORF type:complete len:350 (-),score=60.56 TRINITY_DN6195_c0_g1_i1:418-1467(-)
MGLECAGNLPSKGDLCPAFENNSTEPQCPKSRDASKKKKVNRRAKLKQSKLDVRREQWLSQGKNKIFGQRQNQNNSVHQDNKNALNVTDGDCNRQGNDLLQREPGDSTSNSSFSDRDSRVSKSSVEEDESWSSEDNNNKGQGSNGSQDEEHEERDPVSDVEDDWEAAADALNVGEPKSPLKCLNKGIDATISIENRHRSYFSIQDGMLRPEYKIKSPNPPNRSSRSSNCRAWRPDDTCRPNCLPKLTKLNTFPSQSFRHCWDDWSNSSKGSIETDRPLLCPVCYEDLDPTDTKFSPCPCGFRLCLFCHKRIMEQDARCPGCRKRYNVNDIAFKEAIVSLPRSFSMSLKT